MRRGTVSFFLLCALSLLVVACAAGDDLEVIAETPEAAAPPAAVRVEAAAVITPQADLVRYSCGYAISGFGCDNGRGHVDVFAASMQDAISACRASQPPSLPDFCYVLDTQGGTSSDAIQCGAASGSWRPGTSCCNFFGTVSCPAQNPQYRCGYALSGFGCNNGRGSVLLFAANMQAAITACHAAQPASLPDFCYVRPTASPTVLDPGQCAMLGGTWRTASTCCNFLGSVSCL